MVGSTRIHIDDRATHCHLTTRLNLVLAAITDRDEIGKDRIAIDLHTRSNDDRLHVFDMWTEALHQRSNGRNHHRRQVPCISQPPDDAEPAAHRLHRRRHALEWQGLPRRKHLDLVRTEKLA